jgi:membrane protein
MDNPIERPLRALDGWQQRHRLPAVVVAVVKKFGDDQAGSYVAQLTYYAFVSTFPLLLVLVTVTEIFLGNHPELRQQLLDSALSEFPIAGPTLQQSVRTPSGSGLAVVVGLVLAFWGGSGLAGTMQTVLNSLWLVPKRQWPGFPWNYLRSIALILLLGLGVVLTALMAAFAGAGHVLGLSGTGVHLLTIVLTTLVYCGLFLLGFRLAVSRQVPTGDLVLGAVLSGLAWQVLLTLGGTLATRLYHSREVTGVFALVLGLLGWFALQATVTVYVVELDVVRARHLWPRSLAQPPLTEADEHYLRASAQAEARRPEQRVQVDFDDSAEDSRASADSTTGSDDSADDSADAASHSDGRASPS